MFRMISMTKLHGNDIMKQVSQREITERGMK